VKIFPLPQDLLSHTVVIYSVHKVVRVMEVELTSLELADIF